MELFIEKVKLCTCLWDMNHLSYRDIGKKDLAWEHIARECGMANGKEAKSQWKKLRDSHREALRRRKTSTGQAAQNVKPWKYETLMEFIQAQTENRATSSNFSNDSQPSIHDTRNTSDTNTNSNVVESPSPPPESSHPIPTSTESERKKQKKLVVDNLPEILKQREQRREQRQTERDELRRKIIDMDRVPQDALTNLFTSCCQKTRELPKFLQLRVQRQIFETVTRAEEEALSYESINTYFSTTSSSISSYGDTTARNTRKSSLPHASTVTQPSPTHATNDLIDISTQNQHRSTYVSSPSPDISIQTQHRSPYTRSPSPDISTQSQPPPTYM